MWCSEDEGELVALVSRAAVALDTRAVRARGFALWVTESGSELNAWTTLTPGMCIFICRCKGYDTCILQAGSKLKGGM